MTETWVRNCWYVAAPAHEIGRELLARTFLNTPVVLFRREDGTAVALEDRCSHRFLPLSKGFLVGDRVQCGYHGMEFGCDGACEHVPGQKSRPPGADIKSFPIAEKWQFVWIWMGDAEHRRAPTSNPSPLPRNGNSSGSGWAMRNWRTKT